MVLQSKRQAMCGPVIVYGRIISEKEKKLNLFFTDELECDCLHLHHANIDFFLSLRLLNAKLMSSAMYLLIKHITRWALRYCA